MFFWWNRHSTLLPKFCIFSDNLSHHMLHQNESWDTFPPWEDCFKRWLSLILLLVFSSENQWLLSISCSHIVFLSDVFFFIFSLFLMSFFSCIFSYLLLVVFIYCSFLFLFKMSGCFFSFLSPIPTNSLSFFLLFRYHGNSWQKYFWLNGTV